MRKTIKISSQMVKALEESSLSSAVDWTTLTPSSPWDMWSVQIDTVALQRLKNFLGLATAREKAEKAEKKQRIRENLPRK